MGRQRVAARDRQRKSRKIRREGKIRSCGDEDDRRSERRGGAQKRCRTKNDGTIRPTTPPDGDGDGHSGPTEGSTSNAPVAGLAGDGDTAVPPGVVSEMDAETRRIERMRRKNQQRKEARKAKNSMKRVAGHPKVPP